MSIVFLIMTFIGKAFLAQILSLKIELYILMFVGILLLFLGKTDRQKTIGIILLGLSLIFYGLQAIDWSFNTDSQQRSNNVISLSRKTQKLFLFIFFK